MRQRWEEAAHALSRLNEIAPREDSGLEEMQHVTIDVGPSGFHHIKGERVAVRLVCVDNAKTGIKPDGNAREPCLGFQKCIAVVEPYADRVRVWNFLLMAHVAPFERSKPGAPQCLVAAYERNPNRWTSLRWFDRASADGQTYRIHTGSGADVIAGALAVQSLREYFDDYRHHPEAKAAAADGSSCDEWTRGLLQPRHIQPQNVLRIGKEANRLAEDEEVVGLEDQPIHYREPVCRCGCGRPVAGKKQWYADACRKRAERASETKRPHRPGRRVR